MGLGIPTATSIGNLRRDGRDGEAREEVWGLPWHGNVDFPGLAYCVGGRSLYWGGWVPQPLAGELAGWPASALTDLEANYYPDALAQTGGDQANDFISGRLHLALRQRLFDGYGHVGDAIPLAELPLHLSDIPAAEQEISKLEAPLGVQSRAPRAGFFAFNKFSELPLLVRAARAAWTESGGDDRARRLMVVPQCHVTRLVCEGGRVVTVETNRGPVGVPGNGVVILAAAAVESARLALTSLPDPGGLIGRNLTVHLRSNMTIRVPRAAFPGLSGFDLQQSALFIKCRHTLADGRTGWYHLQVTAAGGGPMSTDAEAELFRAVPDIDLLHTFASADEQAVVVTIRGEGEMQANPDSYVRLDPEFDEFGVPRAFVELTTKTLDEELWDAMDAGAEEVAEIIAGGGAFEQLLRNRDGLGTTHHEAGTLSMGDDPASSVTNTDCRFHAVPNVYAVGLAVMPGMGSVNPMLVGLSLARRLADHLAA
jgi:choline dehydrogenase-like flavoprotein